MHSVGQPKGVSRKMCQNWMCVCVCLCERARQTDRQTETENACLEKTQYFS